MKLLNWFTNLWQSLWAKKLESTVPPEHVEKIYASVKANNLQASPDDDRDYFFVPTVDPTNIIKTSNYRFTTDIEDQLSLGSCTGHATTSVCEAINNTVLPMDFPRTELSRLFSYQMAQVYDDIYRQGDVGAVTRSAIRAAKTYGLPLESDYPYSVEGYKTLPSDEVKAKAAARKVGRYERIFVDRDNFNATFYAIESALAQGCKLVIAMKVPRWLFYVSGPMSEHWKFPSQTGHASDYYQEIMGFHAIVLGDFDKHIASGGGVGNSYILENSWGTQWGDNGRYAMPKWQFLMNVTEIWVIRQFNGVTVGGEISRPPLTAQQISDGRAWLISRGLGSFSQQSGFNYFGGSAMVGNYVAAGASRRAGYTSEEYAQIIGLPVADVKAFMENPDPAHQALINAYAQ